MNVGGFTLGHCCSLFLVVLNYIPVFEWLEFLIAFSIFLMASEAASVSRQVGRAYGLVSVCFLFGLLHGMGFAAALDVIGLEQNFLVWSVLAFNIGIELGQVFFVGICIAFYHLVRRFHADWPVKFERWLIYVIGVTSVYWMWSRLPIQL